MDATKNISRADRSRMAADRTEMLMESQHISASERAEIQAEVALLQDFSVNVSFDGVTVQVAS